MQEILVRAGVQGGDGGGAAQEDNAVREVVVFQQESQPEDGRLQLIYVEHWSVRMRVFPRNLQ